MGKIAENIDSPPESTGLVRLQSDFDIFLEATKRCDQLTQEVHAVFKKWGELAQHLREVIIHTEEKAGEAAWQPQTRLMIYTESEPVKPSTPAIPELSPPSSALLKEMSNVPSDDVLWATLPEVEMWFRRCYKAFTGNAAGEMDWTYAASQSGQLYLTVMIDKMQKCHTALTDSPAANKSEIFTRLANAISVRLPD